jgi:PTH2 family peptidyl-tRNA hydrolase
LNPSKNPGHEIKQVIVINGALGMRKGKIAAQVAHASMKVFFDMLSVDKQCDEPTHWNDGIYDHAHGDPHEHGVNCSYRMSGSISGPMAYWATRCFKKIVLSVASDDDLVRVHQLAIDAGLPAAMMTDNGETEFRGVLTRTAVAIGPYYSADLDKITGAGGLVSTKLI